MAALLTLKDTLKDPLKDATSTVRQPADWLAIHVSGSGFRWRAAPGWVKQGGFGGRKGGEKRKKGKMRKKEKQEPAISGVLRCIL